ncbi:hypothetical protein CBB_A0168 [Clostridium botulinum Bf]|nr:hypothetical protein CBB_A0168 [Clostridium botulinum Bf]
MLNNLFPFIFSLPYIVLYNYYFKKIKTTILAFNSCFYFNILFNYTIFKYIIRR